MVLGALWSLAISGGGHGLATVHWLAMLVAVALAEMGAGKAKTAIR
jgi:hypothetical protein